MYPTPRLLSSILTIGMLFTCTARRVTVTEQVFDHHGRAVEPSQRFGQVRHVTDRLMSRTAATDRFIPILRTQRLAQPHQTVARRAAVVPAGKVMLQEAFVRQREIQALG